jgi:hypothetical protein
LGGALLAISTASAAAPETEKPRSRREFAAAMNKLKEGIPADEAMHVLGPPDDIRTHSDPPGIGTTHTKEIWRYGTSGHMTTATLGQVYIDDHDQVQYFFGQGEPSPNDLLPEAQLRTLLIALDEVPSYNSGSRFNPRLLIRAVNLLQPLGKEKALDVIAEYLRVTPGFQDDGREGMFLVLRALFDVPESPGYMPRMLVGAPQPSEPADHKLLPRFPLTIEQGVPLLLVEGYILGGQPEPPSNHLKKFREGDEFKLRTGLLVPPDQPFKALEDFTRSPQWRFNEDSETASRTLINLRNQLLRLIDTVYRLEPDQSGDLLPWDDKAAEKVLKEASQLKIRWSAEANKYVFLNGASLPEPERKDYRIHFWRPKVPGLELCFSTLRDSPRYVKACPTQGYIHGQPSANAMIRVYEAANKQRAIVSFCIKGDASSLPADVDPALFAGQHGERSERRVVELPAETGIQAELIVDGKSFLSPVLKP